MILLLRTDKPEAELYLYDDETLVDSLQWHAHRTLSETIFDQIEVLLERNGQTKKSLTAIGVYQGPGTFTGLRIGITVANTVAYSLGIAVIAASGEQWRDEILENNITDAMFTDSVIPNYGSDAHITAPRK